MDDLKLIKKYYGEKMSHLCRDLFPSILETEGLLFKLLSNNFHYSKFLYDDLIEWQLVNKFKNYIYNLFDHKKEEIQISDKNPYELMDEAGYTLYKCETERDIQRFKKYYVPGEELCTFHGGRLNRCHVFFAVKKNVDEIKRENYNIPDRQDEYGTSVISIQFSRGNNNYLSIKNRYNHTVINPDATFSNNLDNIIPGLTYSFEREFGYEIENNDKKNYFEIPGYVKASNGKRYKYNYEIDTVYYCTDNIMIQNGRVMEQYLDKNRYLVFDYFVLDLKNKCISCFENSDSFMHKMNNLNINKIDVVKNEEGNKEITFITKKGKIVITIDRQNRMISYYDSINTVIPDNYFLRINYIKDIHLANVKNIHNSFISLYTYTDKFLNSFVAPNLLSVGNNFMSNVKFIENFLTPKLKTAKNSFLEWAGLKNYDLQNLEKVGSHCLEYNSGIKVLYLPSLKEAGNHFFEKSTVTKKIYLPNLKKLGYASLTNLPKLKRIYIPKLESADENFLFCVPNLEKFNAPKLKTLPNCSLWDASSLKRIDAPSAKSIGSYVFALNGNKKLEYLNIPKVNTISDRKSVV